MQRGERSVPQVGAHGGRHKLHRDHSLTSLGRNLPCQDYVRCKFYCGLGKNRSPLMLMYGCPEKGKCRAGKCIPFCETQGEQSCMCDSSADACKRCCRRNLNSSCNAVAPVDILPDGTPCFQGFCNKGTCEKTSQDIVRIWDFIDDISISSFLKFLKDNVVGTVIIVSLLFWVPISCLVR